jgi:hypothetical protein
VAGRHAERDPPPIAEPLVAPLALAIAHPAAAYNEPFAAPAPTLLGSLAAASGHRSIEGRGIDRPAP